MFAKVMLYKENWQEDLSLGASFFFQTKNKTCHWKKVGNHVYVYNYIGFHPLEISCIQDMPKNLNESKCNWKNLVLLGPFYNFTFIRHIFLR